MTQNRKKGEKARETEFSSTKRPNRTSIKHNQAHDNLDVDQSDHPLIQLQRQHGNQMVQRLVKERIQPKLKISEPGDKYEREADTIADYLLRRDSGCTAGSSSVTEEHTLTDVTRKSIEESNQTSPFSTQQPVNRKREQPRAGREMVDFPRQRDTGMAKLQRRQDGQSDGEISGTGLESRIRGNGEGGRPLSGNIRSLVEQTTPHDLSDVRIHDNKEAANLNNRLSARAFTYGRDIYFGEGEYNPSTTEGKQLIAHEVAHVLQQRDGSALPTSDLIGRQAPAALKAGEWIAASAVGYDLTKDAIDQTRGDVSYKFDEMEGVLLPTGGGDVAAYREQYPNTQIRSYEHTVSTWIEHISGARAMGIKFGISFNYDGHAIGNISCRIIDTYDWPAWEGTVNVNFTPMSLTGGGVASVRITLNLTADRTLLGGTVSSRILYLDATGTIRKTGSGAWVRFNE